MEAQGPYSSPPRKPAHPDGRRLIWAWCWIDGMQQGISRFRASSPPDDGVLRISPLHELETLRADEVKVDGISPPQETRVIDDVAGDSARARHPDRARILSPLWRHRPLRRRVQEVSVIVEHSFRDPPDGDTEAPFIADRDSAPPRVHRQGNESRLRRRPASDHRHPPTTTTGRFTSGSSRTPESALILSLSPDELDVRQKLQSRAAKRPSDATIVG